MSRRRLSPRDVCPALEDTINIAGRGDVEGELCGVCLCIGLRNGIALAEWLSFGGLDL